MIASAASANPSNPARQLVRLAVLMVAMFVCLGTLRFTNTWFNLAFLTLLLLIPFLAILPLLRLPRRAKAWSAVLVLPLLAISVLRLSMLAIFDIPSAFEHRQMRRELSTLELGRYSVHLTWEETAGGALGPHRVSLEQRIALLPGLYAVKPLDFFEGASEGTLSSAGSSQVRLRIPRTRMHNEVDRLYSIKPWLFF